MLLLDNVSEYLVRFADRLEEKEIVSTDQASKIRKYVRREESPSLWYLFLVLSGMLGAIIFSAGVYSISSHNWYDYPEWLRVTLGFMPTVAGLFFYYRMLTKHPNSTAWIEGTSLFLMLMIGASIATISRTYHMGGDYEDFILTMLFATVPLFYIKRASGIAFFYLLLALLYLALDIRVDVFTGTLDFGGNSVWFWIFIVALLPHYYMTMNRDGRAQSLRFRFLTLILYFSIYGALMASVDGNLLVWALAYNVGFYLITQRFASKSLGSLRLMSFLTQLGIAVLLIGATMRFIIMQTLRRDSFFNMDDYDGGEWYYFLLLLVVLGGIYYNYFKTRDHYENSNKLMIFAPLLIIALMILDFLIDLVFNDTWWWLISLIMNAYVFFLAVTVMVSGSEQGRFLKMISGLFVLAILVTIRYFDVDMGFIWKGLLFMSFGVVFFLINMFVKEKVDQVERNKKRTIDGK